MGSTQAQMNQMFGRTPERQAFDESLSATPKDPHAGKVEYPAPGSGRWVTPAEAARLAQDDMVKTYMEATVNSGSQAQLAAVKSAKNLEDQGAKYAGDTRAAGDAAAAGMSNLGTTLLGTGATATTGAMGAADRLMGVEAGGAPTAAQAQLTQGTNAAMASNLALARSGRGWGGSASALGQAQDANAVAMQEASTQAAILRAQEEQAYRERVARNYATAGGLLGDIGTRSTAMGASAQETGYDYGIAGITGAAGTEMGATTTAAGIRGAGYGTSLGAKNQAFGMYDTGVGWDLERRKQAEIEAENARRAEAGEKDAWDYFIDAAGIAAPALPYMIAPKKAK